MSEDPPLIEELKRLPPWLPAGKAGAPDWAHLKRVAKRIQRAPDRDVIATLEAFQRWALQDPGTGFENESRVFLLMRVLFDLPERSRASERTIRKGWINWEQPDREGCVNLAWPIRWNNGDPILVAPYAGSEGRPYDVVGEFADLRGRFSYRRL